MMINNTELRTILDNDYNNLQLAKRTRISERNNTYKYGNQNNQKVVEADIPQWAKEALTTHKPGEIIGQYSQDNLRNRLNKR